MELLKTSKQTRLFKFRQKQSQLTSLVQKSILKILPKKAVKVKSVPKLLLKRHQVGDVETRQRVESNLAESHP